MIKKFRLFCTQQKLPVIRYLLKICWYVCVGMIDVGEIKKYMKDHGLNVSDSDVQRLVDK